jgi:hypothetical protein
MVDLLRRTFVFVVALVAATSILNAQSQPPTAASPTATLSIAEQELFLAKAKVVRTRGVNTGITGILRATLSDGLMTHDASIQTIDEYKQRFEGTQGTEFNFRDTWRYNVAAYKLDRLLELGMIPAHVERIYNGKKGSFGWWVDDVLMDEGARLKKKVEAPDAKRWNEQMWHVRLFDQLIYNVDRNLGNLLIDTEWRIWMIDHTRAFRVFDTIKTPGNLSRADRRLIDRLRALDKDTLRKTMKDYLTPSEIDTLLKRRDVIVKHFEKAPGLIFDWDRPIRPAQ